MKRQAIVLAVISMLIGHSACVAQSPSGDFHWVISPGLVAEAQTDAERAGELSIESQPVSAVCGCGCGLSGCQCQNAQAVSAEVCDCGCELPGCDCALKSGGVPTQVFSTPAAAQSRQSTRLQYRRGQPLRNVARGVLRAGWRLTGAARRR